MKVVFLGTPEFSAQVLEFLLQNKVNIVAVITKPDKPKGRSGIPIPTPVKQVAQRHQIPLFQPVLVSAPDFADTLRSFEPDLFVVAAYGEIIKQHLLDMPKKGCINLHTSLLPKYRGAAPIQHAIMNGEIVTGPTIIYMVKKMDAGDIIKTVQVPIGPNDLFPAIEAAICKSGSVALLEVIRQLEKGPVQGIPQNEALVTYAPKIELEDCHISWSKSAQELHNLVRAVTPEPAAWCYVTVRDQQKRLKIFETRVVNISNSSPGQILSYGKQGLIIACGKDALQLLHVQLEGKKVMTAEELMRGIARENLKF